MSRGGAPQPVAAGDDPMVFAAGPDSGFAYAVTEHGRVTALDLAQVREAPRNTWFLWIHIAAEDEACLDWLERQSGLHPAVVTALEAAETRPRAEALEHGALLNLRGVSASEPLSCGLDELVSIRLWAEKGRVISLSYKPLAALPDLRLRVEEGTVTDAGDLIAVLVEVTTDRLDPAASDLSDRLDKLETRLAKNDRGISEELSDIRLEAIELKRFLWPQKEAVARLVATNAYVWLNMDDRLHIREAGDRLARMSEEIESVRERAAVLADQLFDMRQAEANQRNLLLSIVAAIFLPLGYVAGLFGMNVGGIPFAESPNGFWEMTGITVLMGLSLVGWFRFRGWL